MSCGESHSLVSTGDNLYAMGQSTGGRLGLDKAASGYGIGVSARVRSDSEGSGYTSPGSDDDAGGARDSGSDGGSGHHDGFTEFDDLADDASRARVSVFDPALVTMLHDACFVEAGKWNDTGVSFAITQPPSSERFRR